MHHAAPCRARQAGQFAPFIAETGNPVRCVSATGRPGGRDPLSKGSLPIAKRLPVALMCYSDFLAKRPAMSTTTIRLPEALKARVAAVAKRSGTTPHSFILEAIAEKAEERERRSEFHDLAESRYAEIVASGKAVPWSEMRQYLERRLAGEKPKKPAGKKLAR